MKHILFLIAGALVASSSFADNTQDMSNDTHKETKNILTGTKHIKDKSKKKIKTAKGTEEVDVVKKTAIKKNGEVKEHVEIEGDSTKKPE